MPSSLLSQTLTSRSSSSATSVSRSNSSCRTALCEKVSEPMCSVLSRLTASSASSPAPDTVPPSSDNSSRNRRDANSAKPASVTEVSFKPRDFKRGRTARRRRSRSSIREERMSTSSRRGSAGRGQSRGGLGVASSSSPESPPTREWH